MARPLFPLTLTTEQQELLETISRCREIPYSLIQRVRIVLSAGAGCNNKTISQDTGLCEDTVGLWRKRWLEGCAGLEKLAGKPKLLREAVSQLLADKPRPGSPGVFTAEQICRLLAIACETPPEHLSPLDATGTGPYRGRAGYCGTHISQQCRAFFKIRGI